MQMPTDGRTTDDKAMLGGRTDCIMGYCNPATYKQRARCGRKLNRNKEVYVCGTYKCVLDSGSYSSSRIVKVESFGRGGLTMGWLAGWLDVQLNNGGGPM